MLSPYASNLNKRLTKTPKLYFLDTGLAIRLMGWQEQRPLLLASPQAGTLFETVVSSEIVKFIWNYGIFWQIHLWRTKEGEEINFLLITPSGDVVALDANMSTHSVQPISLPPTFSKAFPKTRSIVLVTFGGQRIQLSRECPAVPLLLNFATFC